MNAHWLTPDYPRTAILLLIALFSSCWAQAQPLCAPVPPNLVAWWPGDAHTLDAIGTRFAVLQGRVGYSAGQVGQAFGFDGSQARVRILESTNTDLSRLPRWTLEAWVRPAAFANVNYPTIYSEGNRIVTLGVHGSGKLESWVNNDSARRLVGTNALQLNQWNHVALVYDGTRRLLYLNGVLDGATNTPALTDDSAGAAIGHVTQNDPNGPFAGDIDEVCLYNRALSAAEILTIAAHHTGKCFNGPAPSFALPPESQTAYLGEAISLTGIAMGTPRPAYQWWFNDALLPGETNFTLTIPSITFSHDGIYTLVASNVDGSTSSAARVTVKFCADTPSGLVAWWPADGSGLDATGRHHGDVWGGTNYHPAGIAGAAFRFNGIDAYVSVADSAELSPHLGTNGEMTVEAWVNLAQLPAADPVTGQDARTVLAKGSPGQWEYAVSINTAGVPAFALWNLNGSTYASVAGGQIITGQWHHVVATLKKGDSVKLYQDGQLVGTSTDFTGDTGDGGSPLYLGRRGDAQFLRGCVDEAGLYSRALALEEIVPLYAGGAFGKCSVAPNPAPYFAQQPANQTGYLLLGAGLSSFAIGTPRPEYQWYRSNATEWVLLMGATNGSLALTDLTAESEGNYRVTASNLFGSTVSDSAYLKIVPHDLLTGGEHFEKGWNGWTTDGPVWQVGRPPGQTNTLAATVLDGDYPYGTDSRLTSPALDLPSVTPQQQLVLRFWQHFDYWYGYWNDNCNAGWGGDDYGQVTVQVYDANTSRWSGWTNLARVARSSAVFAPTELDFTAYSGQRVRIGFFHADVTEDTDSCWGTHHYESSGWTLDDVSIERRTVLALPLAEGFENGWGGWSASTGVWQVDRSAAAYAGSQCAGTVLGGHYPWETDSRLTSPAIDLPMAGTGEELVMEYWQSFSYWYGYWNDNCNAGWGGNDYGEVQIQVYNPNVRQWLGWTTLSRVSLDSAGWVPGRVDLTDFAGQRVRVGFLHADLTEDTDNCWGTHHYQADGWNIDDVRLEKRVVEPFPGSESFEQGLSGWYPEMGVWAVGVPTVTPGGAFSGSNCVGTVLAGAYPWGTDSRLVSPLMNLPEIGVGEELVLRFWQWFSYWYGYWNDNCNAGWGANDYGAVQIQVYHPDTRQWSGWTNLLTVARASAVWSPAQVDLTGYAGRQVRIGFNHVDVIEDTDNCWGTHHYEGSGWYIDEVRLETRAVESLSQPEGFERGWKGWFTERGVWEVGSPVGPPGGAHSGSRCAATVLAGNYPWETDSRLVSPVLDLPAVSAGEPLNLKFWQWYNYWAGSWNDNCNSGSGGNDYGQVQLQVYDPTTLQWSGWAPLLRVSYSSGGWAQSLVDITSYAGKRVRLGFFHTDATEDTDNCWGIHHWQARGWYLDDIFVQRGTLAIGTNINRMVNEGQTLTFPVTVFGTTPDSCLSYQLIDAPPGATIDPVSGVFSWTPTECQGPGAYTIPIYVVDFCNNEANDLGFVQVTVTEVNERPWLMAHTNSVDVLQTNLIPLICWGDSDCPSNPFSFTLLGAPAGASIDDRGVLHWAPALDQLRSQPYVMQVRLCDNGTPNYCATNFLSVTVTTNSALQIQHLSGSDFRFTIVRGRSDLDYELEQSDTICSCACQTPWQSVGRVSPTSIPYSFLHRSEDPFMLFRLREVPRLP